MGIKKVYILTNLLFFGNKRLVSDSAETSFGSSFGCYDTKLVSEDTLDRTMDFNRSMYHSSPYARQSVWIIGFKATVGQEFLVWVSSCTKSTTWDPNFEATTISVFSSDIRNDVHTNKCITDAAPFIHFS